MTSQEEAKIAVCKKVERVVGYIPQGLGDILSILAHPDVIELTKKFLEEKDKSG